MERGAGGPAGHPVAAAVRGFVQRVQPAGASAGRDVHRKRDCDLCHDWRCGGAGPVPAPGGRGAVGRPGVRPLADALYGGVPRVRGLPALVRGLRPGGEQRRCGQLHVSDPGDLHRGGIFPAGRGARRRDLHWRGRYHPVRCGVQPEGGAQAGGRRLTPRPHTGEGSALHQGQPRAVQRYSTPGPDRFPSSGRAGKESGSCQTQKHWKALRCWI